jgi:dTDP-4-amino-4,6-dideoxygalactose transaminase
MKIPLCVPNLNGNEKKYLNECIDTTFVSSIGAFVAKFEDAVALSAGVPCAVACSSGTTALHIALTACGVKRDDLVIIPSYTFIATANAISHCGASPYLIDCRADDWTIDAGLLKEELRQNARMTDIGPVHMASSKRIAAIVPVYSHGGVPQMKCISQIAYAYGIPVIADAAAAIGACYQSQPIGLYADATVFSFNGNKTVTCGGGGAVVTAKNELGVLIRHMLSTARVGTGYDHDMVGYNYRITNLQAAVGLAQMERLEFFLHKKREIRAYYAQELSGLPGISLFPDLLGESVCWLSGVVTESRDDAQRLRCVLEDKGIESHTFWKPMHLQSPYRDCLRTEMPICESLWERVIPLPSSTGITEAELAKVVATVKESISV